MVVKRNKVENFEQLLILLQGKRVKLSWPAVAQSYWSWASIKVPLGQTGQAKHILVAQGSGFTAAGGDDLQIFWSYV